MSVPHVVRKILVYKTQQLEVSGEPGRRPSAPRHGTEDSRRFEEKREEKDGGKREEKETPYSSITVVKDYVLSNRDIRTRKQERSWT